MVNRFRRQLLRQPRREAWVEVNLDALEHNLRVLTARLPYGCGLMAVLKADAYGHGIALTLPVLEGCGVNDVAVSSVDEALEIREVSPDIGILVLGPSPDWALEVASAQRITLAIADGHQLPLMAQFIQQTGQPVNVHVKVDTGMHRVGLPFQQALDFLQQCLKTPGLTVDGVFSHLANGADPDVTHLQVQRWTNFIDSLDAWCQQQGMAAPVHRHLFNTPGWLNQPEIALSTRYHTFVRVGVALWGYGDVVQSPPLRPVMGLKARITHVQNLAPGEGVSYGPMYRTTQPQVIATVPFGYADGIPRGLSNRLTGVCQGQIIQQVGAITMDQMMWDVSAVPDVALGAVVTVLDTRVGSPLTLTPWAVALNTIEYEMMCGLRVRLPKIYCRD